MSHLIDVALASAALDRLGYALTGPLLSPVDCAELVRLYDLPSGFRSTVTMARHGYGRGEYRYFAYPLPPVVQALRTALYPSLAQIANDWAQRLGEEPAWPPTHDLLLAACHAGGQHRPTPLLLRYRAGDYNCLHQDLYGPLVFPLQLVVLLTDPADFSGGHLTLVETRPRQQSRCEVAPLTQGQGAIIPVRARPTHGARGVRLLPMRHGVTTVYSGERHSLGIIFHDAA